MAVLTRLGGAMGASRNTAMMAAAVAKLLRAFAAQVEALRRLKHGGSQFVRVEHVHVGDGGQAVIGTSAIVRTPASRAAPRPQPFLARAVASPPERA